MDVWVDFLKNNLNHPLTPCHFSTCWFVIQHPQSLSPARERLPVCQHGEGAVVADQVAEHADLLRPEELQWQRLPRDQDESGVREDGEILHAVVVVKSAPVELLHV